MHWSAFQEMLVDTYAIDHWSVNESVNLNEHDEVVELLRTGSVTTKIAGRKFEVVLTVEEVAP